MLGIQRSPRAWGCCLIALLLIIPRAAPAQPADLVARLITDLKNRDAMVRRVAVVALGGIGPRAKEVIPALIAALTDDDPGVRQTAAGALGGIGPEAKEAIPGLITALKDDDPGVRGTRPVPWGESARRPRRPSPPSSPPSRTTTLGCDGRRP